MSTTLLCILDGFGFNPNPKGNAVALAKKPNIDRLISKSPSTTLITHGERVGLPEGQMGNSEVGHLNIGAGRVVEQWLLRISKALQGNYLDQSEEYQHWIKKVSHTQTIHIIGLFSDGGVHSHSEHLMLLIERLKKETSATLLLHIITDGRDTATNRSKEQIQELEQYLKTCPQCKIASVSGRFYAMDRDKRWERTKQAYEAIALGNGHKANSALSWIEKSHASGTTDEFIEPASIINTPIGAGDGLLFWNFREDRMRQIVSAIALKDFSGFSRTVSPPPSENILCFTDYDHTFKLPFVFPILNIKNHIGEIISNHGLKQLRVAETEKYPHVTYFFNGGVETLFPGEERKLIPSPREVKTYDLKPQMSAPEVSEIVLEAIRSDQYRFIVLNFANCDMVGHTGVLEAAIKAVETVDTCLGKILLALEQMKGDALIIADHGNADQMINYEDGTPHTTHTKYPVPAIYFNAPSGTSLRSGGALCDVAPTLLKIMGIPKPSEMTGESLF